MKNVLIIMVVVVGLAIASYFIGEAREDYIEAQIEAQMDSIRENSNGSKFLRQSTEVSVDDNQNYFYKVTNVNGNEIHGDALNNVSSTNNGVFLYQNELSFDVSVGDEILIVWGEDDELLEVKKVN